MLAKLDNLLGVEAVGTEGGLEGLEVDGGVVGDVVALGHRHRVHR